MKKSFPDMGQIEVRGTGQIKVKNIGQINFSSIESTVHQIELRGVGQIKVRGTGQIELRDIGPHARPPTPLPRGRPCLYAPTHPCPYPPH